MGRTLQIAFFAAALVIGHGGATHAFADISTGGFRVSDPPQFDFRRVPAGHRAEHAFVVTNDTPFAASNVYAEVGHLPFSLTGGTCGNDLPPYSSCTLVVTFEPWLPGRIGDILRVSCSLGKESVRISRYMIGGARRNLKVVAGGAHTCAIVEDGAVKCWGDNSHGQLGLGDTRNRGDDEGEMGGDLPYVDLGQGRSAEELSLGQSHTCALLDDATIKCWGANSNGQLGLGDTADRGVSPGQLGNHLAPIDLGYGARAIAVAAGGFHTCALLDDGTVKCWGYNAHGELGLGDNNDRGGYPGQMGIELGRVDLGQGRRVQAIAAGYLHTCALTDDAIKCWGRNEDRQLGLGDTLDRGADRKLMGDSLPNVDLGRGLRPKTIAAGGHSTCAILQERLPCKPSSPKGGCDAGPERSILKCWGDNRSGRLGGGDVMNRGDAESVVLGTFHTCATFNEGGSSTLQCWGWNAFGQLGLGDSDDRPRPERVDTGGRSVTGITAGFGQTCAVLSPEIVKCWGQNSSGQLGLGDILNRGGSYEQRVEFLPPVRLSCEK